MAKHDIDTVEDRLYLKWFPKSGFSHVHRHPQHHCRILVLNAAEIIAELEARIKQLKSHNETEITHP